MHLVSARQNQDARLVANGIARRFLSGPMEAIVR